MFNREDDFLGDNHLTPKESSTDLRKKNDENPNRETQICQTDVRRHIFYKNVT